MDERLYWLGFAVFSGIGPVRFQKLLDHFGTAASAWDAGSADLKKAGLGDITVKKLDEFRRNFSIRDYYQKLQDSGVKFFTLRDVDYPKLLSQIKNPPIVLFVKAMPVGRQGEFLFNAAENQRTVAVVGTRRITAYGRQVTELIVRDLVEAGCVIVSGLALGVDSKAHNVTIENNGKTIAVLGSGVDLCTPRENFSLYRKILETGGAIVSEFPLGQEPIKGSFPSRNRIIAGLSLGVVVTEGAADSGALITAEDAFLNKRKVFAVPGPITSNYSKGPNSLIAKGAITVNGSRDILQAFEITQKPRVRNVRGENKDEQAIIDFLQNEQLHMDELIKRTGIQVSAIGTILSLMEMKGLVRNLGAGIFALGEIG
ncbi:DNA-processing protein DprA [Patescibacteria group bacterium]|nr:DNA-processing protein DprA [Patescibacteria group bacterium]MBU4099149.1 DNA-processing protein DprA [Patescibacteria group bacterium]